MLFRNKTPYTLLSLLSILLVTACKNVPPVTSGIGSDQITPAQEYKKHLQLHNPALAKQLYISDIKSRTSNNLLEVNLTLTSTYKKSQQLQYQLQWFDKQGFAIETGKSAWKPLELHGMQTATVAGLAPTTQVDTFSIYVREVPEKFFKF